MLWNRSHLPYGVDYGRSLGIAGGIEAIKWAATEVDSEEEEFERPDWLGAEVTGEAKYYNSMLMKNPFKAW
mgnify:CR=1 FL=1